MAGVVLGWLLLGVGVAHALPVIPGWSVVSREGQSRYTHADHAAWQILVWDEGHRVSELGVRPALLALATHAAAEAGCRGLLSAPIWRVLGTEALASYGDAVPPQCLLVVQPVGPGAVQAVLAVAPDLEAEDRDVLDAARAVHGLSLKLSDAPAPPEGRWDPPMGWHVGGTHPKALRFRHRDQPDWSIGVVAPLLNRSAAPLSEVMREVLRRDFFDCPLLGSRLWVDPAGQRAWVYRDNPQGPDCMVVGEVVRSSWVRVVAMAGLELRSADRQVVRDAGSYHGAGKPPAADDPRWAYIGTQPGAQGGAPAAEAERAPAAPEFRLDGAKIVHRYDLVARREVDPAYPPTARENGHGRVNCIARVSIDERGMPYDVVVEHCPGVFHEATVHALRKWRFAPYKHAGKKTKVFTTIPVRFRL